MKLINEFHEQGFHVVNNIYSKDEINTISNFINNLDTSNPIFRKTNDLFAIRQFVKEFPEIKKLLFNESLKEIIESIGGKDYFIIKSIFFDKPEKSNWFVSYHQDLTISVDKKIEDENFSNWTTKHNQFSVQPSKEILENIFTIRIHLDDTNEKNGALKVLKKSHLKSICRIDSIEFEKEIEVFCNVNSGGIMLMKPLLFYASNKTTNEKNRRVIHIEFSNKKLPKNLQWSEFSQIENFTKHNS
ncbi:phytanoyl-CoA dioxygenase family protein [Flavobacterium sp.]|uniref:phytanoyl-CoA dioxygenase family protein n=1 Tax=Flavobacterium sp. TaxID=239 RepID=UPI00261E436E|nr:phytanoyl-CoA dioxygenase family protein [Flavobacterium sp.]